MVVAAVLSESNLRESTLLFGGGPQRRPSARSTTGGSETSSSVGIFDDTDSEGGGADDESLADGPATPGRSLASLVKPAAVQQQQQQQEAAAWSWHHGGGDLQQQHRHQPPPPPNPFESSAEAWHEFRTAGRKEHDDSSSCSAPSECTERSCSGRTELSQEEAQDLVREMSDLFGGGGIDYGVC
jgi:hypothetical protein